MLGSKTEKLDKGQHCEQSVSRMGYVVIILFLMTQSVRLRVVQCIECFLIPYVNVFKISIICHVILKRIKEEYTALC